MFFLSSRAKRTLPVLLVAFSVLFGISFLFSSCFLRKEAEPIVFDNSEPSALLPDIKWAVVKDSYSAFHAEPNWESAVNVYCRCGQICKIIGNRTSVNSSGISEKWLKVEGGWIPQNSVTVCSNLYNAKTVSKALQQ